jgi:hypothetical protein
LRRAAALEDLDDDHAAAAAGTGIREDLRLTVVGTVGITGLIPHLRHAEQLARLRDVVGAPAIREETDTLLDLRGNIPSFMHVSDGKLHDVHALDLLLPEAGAIYVMDRGYVDFARLHGLHLAGAFFVTRAKSNINAHRDYSAPTDRATGIICDQTIALNGHYTSQHYPEHLRRIRLRDAESRKTLVFLTNQFGLPAATVCALYKS